MIGVTQALTVSLAILPSLVSAGLFKEGGPVKMLDDAAWRKAMQKEETSITAFVAPWCGHCKNLSPEYANAAESLSPLVPFYAIDCDADANKRLCAEQGIKGFPTVKSFPRGNKGASHDYNGERKAREIANWISSEIPNRATTLKGDNKDKIIQWAAKDSDNKPRVVLLTPIPKVPVMWKVLANKYHKQMSFAVIRDEKGLVAKSLGLKASTDERGTHKARVIAWSKGTNGLEGSAEYTGSLKSDPLSNHLESLINGKVNTKREKQEL
jgi:protein disulfide-isomerase A6